MDKDELRKRALSVTTIPNHFHPFIEEYFEGENGEGEAMFSWTNKKEDEGISINFDLAGNLTRLSIDLHDKHTDKISLNAEERKKQAEQFLLTYYPNALEELTFYEMKILDNAYRFHYELLVMDMPLMSSGALIDVDPAGNIVQFSYEAAEQIPEIPTTLISKEKLIEQVKQKLNFDLIISNLYSSIHSVTEDGLRLVYEPEPSFMNYKASEFIPTLSIIHDDDDISETYIPLAPPKHGAIQKDLSVNELIGITEQMEIIREVDMGEETGIVWRDRNWKMAEQDLSIDGFFKRQTEDTVKAFVSKETGKVRSFMWFIERRGNLNLSREECLQKALEFLQMSFPYYHQYLQLIERETEDEMDEATKKEVFTFNLHNGHGVKILLELVIVAVNRETGQIDHYSGPSFDPKQLSKVPTEPEISSKQAKEIFLKHLDFELAWHRDYDVETDSHILVYQACDLYSRTPIRYIDAMTGAVITAEDN